MTNPQSELSWYLADYQAAGVEPPARITANPAKTEGEMMTDEEIEEFIKDSVATLRILADRRSARYAEVYDVYRTDLAYLTDIGRLTEDDLAELTHPDNLRF